MTIDDMLQIGFGLISKQSPCPPLFSLLSKSLDWTCECKCTTNHSPVVIFQKERFEQTKLIRTRFWPCFLSWAQNLRLDFVLKPTTIKTYFSNWSVVSVKRLSEFSAALSNSFVHLLSSVYQVLLPSSLSR